MNGQTEQNLIGVAVVIFMILAATLVVRFILIVPDINSNHVCRLEYGDNWVYDYSSNFGKTCVELDYVSLEIVNRTQLNLTAREGVDKYCDVPGFWELSKWDNGCPKDE